MPESDEINLDDYGDDEHVMFISFEVSIKFRLD